MTRPKMGHRSDEITSYLSDALESEARASFEAHLKTCKECQDELAAQRALFDQVNEALAFKPKRTIDEQVARFEEQVAEQATRAERRRRLARRTPLAALAIAASAAAAFLVLRQPSGSMSRTGMVAAPRAPEPVDGGVDGGDGEAASGGPAGAVAK